MAADSELAGRTAALGGPAATVFSVVAFGAIATASLGAEPVIAEQLSLELHLPAHTAGLLLGTEFLAAMLAVLPTALWCRRASLRQVALFAALLFLIANLCAGCHPTVAMLFVWRAMSGLAGGALLIAVLATAARCENPERVYAIWVAGQTLTSAAVLWTLPGLFQAHGLGTFYLMLALAVFLALPLHRSLWPLPAPAGVAGPAEPGRRREALISLGALGFFYTVVGGLWAFAADRGVATGLPGFHVAAWLAVATCAGLSGSLVAAWIGKSRRRTLLILVGHGQLAIAIGLFAAMNGGIAFALFAGLLQFAWSFTAPFMLAQVAEAGRPDQAMGAANFCMGAGLAVGPALIGALLERSGGYPLAAAACGLLLALGLLVRAAGPRRQYAPLPQSSAPACRRSARQAP